MTDLTDEEKRKIYEEEKARIEAQGEPSPTKGTDKRKGCLLIMVLVFVGIVASQLSKRGATPASRPGARPISAVTAEDERMMGLMRETNLLVRFIPDMNEAFVNPISWATMKVDEKEKAAWFLAQYCGKKKGTGTNWVEVKDAYSGKLLAKYGALGFKVY